MSPGAGESAAAAPSARVVAANVVQRVLSAGAFVSDALDEELESAHLEARDRALATELCYGVVRAERALGDRLEALARRGLDKGDDVLRAHLLVAAYQLLVLDRIPAFAAINEAVTALRQRRGAKIAGFANAILRRLSGSGERLSLAEALETSVPPWLFEELCLAVGRDPALGLLGATPAASRRGLCVRLTARAARESLDWLARAEPGKIAPGALWLPPSGDLRQLAGYANGSFVVQEEGAQWAALALGARSGEQVLDACAGHGQKSTLLAERIQPGGTLHVNDVTEIKLAKLRREFARLGLPAPVCHRVDLSRGSGSLPGGMDRVLVDAPCTGTGTLRRRPEISRRLTASDPRRLADQAVALLTSAARTARPGGRVVFVVCSVLRSECEDVIERVRDTLSPVPFDAPEAARVAGEGAWQHRLLPSEHGTDGYYIASLTPRV